LRPGLVKLPQLTLRRGACIGLKGAAPDFNPAAAPRQNIAQEIIQ
jgi:hypothetical protein